MWPQPQDAGGGLPRLGWVSGGVLLAGERGVGKEASQPPKWSRPEGSWRATPRERHSLEPTPLPVSQGPAEQREGEAQATGSARHGTAPQAVALQAPWQSVPHQDREDTPGAGLADDPSAGNPGPTWSFSWREGRSGHSSLFVRLSRQAPEKDRAEKSQPVTLLLRMMRVGPGAELCCGKGFWVSSQPYQFQEGSHGVLLGRTVESQLKSHEKLSGNLDLWTLYRWVQVDWLLAVIFRLEPASESPGGLLKTQTRASDSVVGLGWAHRLHF